MCWHLPYPITCCQLKDLTHTSDRQKKKCWNFVIIPRNVTADGCLSYVSTERIFFFFKSSHTEVWVRAGRVCVHIVLDPAGFPSESVTYCLRLWKYTVGNSVLCGWQIVQTHASFSVTTLFRWGVKLPPVITWPLFGWRMCVKVWKNSLLFLVCSC